jgi:hypothetical protein
LLEPLGFKEKARPGHGPFSRRSDRASSATRGRGRPPRGSVRRWRAGRSFCHSRRRVRNSRATRYSAMGSCATLSGIRNCLLDRSGRRHAEPGASRRSPVSRAGQARSRRRPPSARASPDSGELPWGSGALHGRTSARTSCHPPSSPRAPLRRHPGCSGDVRPELVRRDAHERRAGDADPPTDSAPFEGSGSSDGRPRRTSTAWTSTSSRQRASGVRELTQERE